MKTTLYLCVEIKVREFLSKIYLACLAAEKNYRVYLGSREEIFKLILNKKKKGGIFFYKAGLQENLFEKISLKVDHHVVLDEEIAPGFNAEQYAKRVISFPRKNVKKISAFFYLNKKISNIVKKVYPEISSDKIITSGWPRFDILKKKKLKIFNEKVKIIKKNENFFLLFVSDFAFISKNYKIYASEYIPWGAKKNEIKKLLKYQVDHAKFTYEDFKKVSKFLIDYSKKTNIKIIIRAHPNDSIKIWKNLLKGNENIKLLEPTDNIEPWIIASSGVLHRGCTTSIQARLLGKKVGYINLSNSNSKKNVFFKKFLYSISDPIKNEKNLSEWIKKKDKNKKKIEKLFKSQNIINNKQSIIIILNKLEQLYTNKENKIIFEKRKRKSIFLDKMLKIKNSIFRKILILFTKLKIIDKNLERFDFSPKIPNGISNSEVNYSLKFFKENKSKITSKKINDELVVIE